MEFTLTITGSLEEMTSAINAISKQQTHERSLFSTLSSPIKNSIPTSIPIHPHKKGGRTRGAEGIPIEIHIGSKESGFVLHKIYNTMQAAAESIGCKRAANIIHAVNNGGIYKGIYKFYRHK